MEAVDRNTTDPRMTCASASSYPPPPHHHHHLSFVHILATISSRARFCAFFTCSTTTQREVFG